MEKLANDAFHEANRQKHGHDGQRGGQNRQANFFGANQGCVIGVFTQLNMPHNVFANHNGVVNEQAHTQRQSHQRDHVDGEAKHAHEPKGADE